MTEKRPTKGTRGAIAAAAALSVIAGPAIAYVNVDERELGRTNPRSAAFYSGVMGNFVETYEDGTALGFTVGMPRSAALETAANAGYTVQPSSWGDHRAGQADLYTAGELRRQSMLAESLHFSSANEDVEVLTLDFHEDRVRSITLGYINFGL